MNPPQLFTRARIAQELGRSRQYVYLAFSGIRTDGETFVRGQRTCGWLPASFPKEIFEQLQAIKERKGFRTIADLLTAPCDRYTPAVVFGEVTSAEQEKALKLRHALTPFLTRSESKNIAAGGVTEYQRIFGYSITERHWRNLFERTIARDGGREEWHRPELYLPEKPARIAHALPITAAREASLEVLEDALSALLPKAPLAVEWKDCLWNKVGDQLQLAVDQGANAKKTKRAILKVLLASGLLGANKETIRRNLDHHWRQYCRNEGKIVDGRRLRDQRVPLSEADRGCIAGPAVRAGLAEAWRSALENGKLSRPEQDRYATNVQSVPHRIRKICGPVAKSIAAVAKDKRSERSDGPSVVGDHSRRYAGETFSMDDWTPENVCFDLLPSGRPRFFQGQLIVVVDEASRRVLQWSFTDGAYSAGMIRVTLNRACAEYCLPDLLNIEAGLWKRAKLIVGSRVIGSEEWEMGLREFMKINHARRPQAKACVEKFFDQLGRLMRGVPAWCGRDARSTMPRDLQRNIAAAESGKVDPRSFCLTREEMIEAISDAVAQYNSRPQPYSKVIGGLSPNEAWNLKQSPAGRPSLGVKAAYLLAYHRERMIIRKCQITKRHRGVTMYYHSPDTARFDRQSVLVWWNPEDLDQIAFSSLDRREGPFVVPRQAETPQTGHPDYAAIGDAQRQIEHTLEARRVVFRSCQPWLLQTRLRPTLTDQSTAVFGEELEAGVTMAAVTRQQEKRQVQTTRRLLRQTGVNADTDDPESAAESARMVQQVIARRAEEKADLMTGAGERS